MYEISCINFISCQIFELYVIKKTSTERTYNNVFVSSKMCNKQISGMGMSEQTNKFSPG